MGKNQSFLISFSRITCSKVKLCWALGPTDILSLTFKYTSIIHRILDNTSGITELTLNYRQVSGNVLVYPLRQTKHTFVLKYD